MASGVGVVELDFGAFPGSNEAMEAREKTRKLKELQDEEEMIVLMLFAS